MNNRIQRNYKLIFFGLVGATSAITYFAAVVLLVEVFYYEPVNASIFGYAISLPVSFLGQKILTFRSKGNIIGEVNRFIVTHTIGVITMYSTMWLAFNILELPFWVGTVLGTMLVPLLSYVLFNFWVFKN